MLCVKRDLQLIVGCSIGSVCTVTEFRCEDGQCIDLGRRCDGQIDCPGAKDEFRCGGNGSVTMDTSFMNNVTMFLCAAHSG